MKKVLIYMRKADLRPTGGPPGYLNNLNEGLQKIECDWIEFLDDEQEPKRQAQRRTTGSHVLDILASAFLRRCSYAKLMKENGAHRNRTVNLNDYDLIHFHIPLDMYSIRDDLSEYQGKILLTSHSPMPYYQELQSNFRKLDKHFMGRLYHDMERMDRYAFERADYLVFPCKQAEEPYEKHWDYYATLQEKKEYRYILSGIKECIAKVNRESIREKYGIPDNAQVFCYVGRHNKVKGYADLKEVAQKVLDSYENAYFLIAGREAPMTGLAHPRWIEVGWTNDPHSIIAASDLFVLPNQETYFDLILLEVLSLGIPVLAKKTGGNTFFENQSQGIMLYNDNSEAIDYLLRWKDKERKSIADMGQANRKLFDKEFTVDVFTSNYIKLYENLLEESSISKVH